MTYALVVSNVIQAEGGIPYSGRIQTGPPELLGGVVNDLANQPAGTQQACGWFQVSNTARPADTATLTTDRSVVLVGAVPTETWTQRAKTQAEIDAATAQTNDTTLRSQASTALNNNTTFLALASPTNADIVAQTKALTRQMNGVIRLVIRQLDATT